MRSFAEGNIPIFFQIKILVPNATAGSIIGKGGSFIKELKSATDAFVMVSQKSREASSLIERCTTISGFTADCFF